MKLEIAEIPVDITGPAADSLHTAFAPYTRPDGKPEIRVKCDTALHIPALPLQPFYGLRHMIEEFGRHDDTYVSQDRCGDSSLATSCYDPDFRKVDLKLVDVESSGGNPLQQRMGVAIKNSIVNCLPSFGGLTLHSSAIRFEDQALLFAAPSGTGKSTHTALWKQYYPDSVAYINDDTPIIRKKNGVFYAYGSPWAGTSGINRNISAPVKAIVYLERSRAGEISINPLDAHQTALRLMCSVRKQYYPEQIERQVKLIFDLIDSVPVYLLRCDISKGAVDTVKSLLFG